MKVAGYVRVSLDCAVDDVLDAEAQTRAIERWAAESDHRLTGVFLDEGFTASGDLETRLGLADAFEALRSGDAEGLVVARLERLAPGMILQEQLLAAVGAMGGSLFSTVPDEARDLASSPLDPKRLLVREVLHEVPGFEHSLRDLWVRQRVRKFPPGDDGEHAALARIEQLAEQGVGVRDIARVLSAEGFRPKLSRVFNIAGLARLVEKLRNRETGERTV